jgi:protein CpxP
MKKETFLVLVIIALLLLNLGTLGYLFMQQQRQTHNFPHHQPPRPDKLIIERLQLNDNQIEQFEESKFKHRSNIIKLEQEAAQLHAAYFSLLKQPKYNYTEADSFQQLLAQNQIEKDSVTFLHFEELKAICTEKQIPLFYNLIEEIGEILTTQPPKRKR